MFYVKDDGGGVERLVHAYIDTNAAIRIGRVDGTTLAHTLNHSISLQVKELKNNEKATAHTRLLCTCRKPFCLF